MGWNEAKEEAENSGSGGLFLKLKNDGDKVKFAIRGEPLGYTRAGFNGSPSKKFLLNVFVPEAGEDAAKVWETNPATFKLLCSLGDEVPLGTNGEQPERMVTLKRNGAARDPSTTYMVFDGGPIPPQVRQDMEAFPLHDLGEISAKAIEKDGGGAATPAPAQPRRQAPQAPAPRQGYQRPATAPAAAPARQSTPARTAAAPPPGPVPSDSEAGGIDPDEDLPF